MNHSRGVILIELLLALGMLTIIGVLITMTFYAGQRSGRTALLRTQAVQLAQEAIDAAKSVAEEDYITLYNLTEGNNYYPAISGGKWTLTAGTEDIALDGATFTRKIVIDNVSRDGSGNIESSYNASNDDPSTQKITATVSVSGQTNVVLTNYYSRWRNTVPAQSDWSTGGGTTGPVTSFGAAYDTDDGNINASTQGSVKLKIQ